MVLLFAGAVFAALGLFSGAVLVAAPLGQVPWSPSVALWVLFPLFTLIGYGLIVVGAKAPHLPRLSFGVSCLLLLLAVVAAVGLVLTATSFVPVVGSPLSLWYVLGVAGLLGSIGAASHRRASSLGAAGT